MGGTQQPDSLARPWRNDAAHPGDRHVGLGLKHRRTIEAPRGTGDSRDGDTVTMIIDTSYVTRYLVNVRIAEPARKHQIPDQDMLHAVRNAIGQWPSDDDFTMFVGPTRDGQLLEVGVLGVDSDDPVIVHAMRCRPQFLPQQRPER